MAEINFVDGTAVGPSSFGETNSNTGQWIAKKYSGSYGTNGFYITGENSAALGTDYSGNGNNFTSSGLTSADQMSDSPTNNWCTLNSVSLASTATLSDGNLTLSNTSTGATTGTLATPSSGKWYFEIKYDSESAAVTSQSVGVVKAKEAYITGTTGGGIYFFTTGLLRVEGVDTGGWGSAWGVGDTIGVAIDLDANKIWFAINNTWQASGNPSAGTNPAASSFSSEPYVALIRNGNASRTTGWTANFGQNAFAYTPPTDFLALNSTNLPDPTIANPYNHFNTVLYEGNGGGQRVGQFQPITETYTVPNSVIFNNDDSPYLTRTPSSAGNRRTYTYSVWLKRGDVEPGYNMGLFGSGPNKDNRLYFRTNTALQFVDVTGGAVPFNVQTNAVLGDPSSWYHVVLAVDTTESTASNRVKIYINGTLQTSLATASYPTQNLDTRINTTDIHYISKIVDSGGATEFDGYMAEINFIDGQQLDPTSFGQLDASTNRWIPKDTSGLTFGTNGFYLDMETAPGTGSGAGTDSSGNGNNFTESGLTAADQVDDSPTKNFYVLSPLSSPLTRGSAMSEGNLKWRNTSDGTSFFIGCAATQRVLGKCYWEVTNTYDGTGTIRTGLFPRASLIQNDYPGGAFGADCIGLAATLGRVDRNGVVGTTYTGAGSGDVNMYAFDEAAGKLWIGLNGTWFNSGDPAAGTGEVAGNIVQSPLFPATSGYGTSSGNFQEFNFGQRAFAHTIPTGFVALNNDNLPLTGAGLSGFVWIKNRDATDNHMLFDAVRGATKDMHSNAVNAEVTNVNTLQRFLLNGFEVGNDVEVNTSGESYVAWQWLYNNLTASSNTDGSITSSVLANTTAGFSIVGYAGNSTIGATIGHGLGATPAMIIVKQRTTATNSDWTVYHQSFGNTGGGYLNSAAAFTTASWWNNTSPTSSVFTADNSGRVNGSGNNYIAYCFAEVEGFSKFGSYAGNGNADGPMINLGFRPAWFLVTLSSGPDESWYIFDDQRDTYNYERRYLLPNASNTEVTAIAGARDNDFVSNGIKIRNTNGAMNTSGATYIFAAFAESPLKTANAR
jgi:hypothetical protein